MGHPFDCFCPICRGDEPYTRNGDVLEPLQGRAAVLASLEAIFRKVDAVIQSVEEEQTMINRQPTSNGGQRGRGRTQNTANLVPYLKAEDLTNEPQNAKILGARIQPDNFDAKKEVVVVKIQMRTGERLYTLRMNNPNLNVLCDALGDDETQWAGHMISLFIEMDEFDHKEWVRAAVTTSESGNEPASKGRKKA